MQRESGLAHAEVVGGNKLDRGGLIVSSETAVVVFDFGSAADVEQPLGRKTATPRASKAELVLDMRMSESLKREWVL